MRMQSRLIAGRLKIKVDGFTAKVKRDLLRHKYIYIMLLPVVAYYFIFHYGPIYGAVIAFQDYSPALGVEGSTWVGFQNFTDFFHNYYFWRLIKNTVLLSFYLILFGFPAPIVLALMLNEVNNTRFKRTVQTVTYLPHFISLVVICGFIVNFTSRGGIINDIIETFGGERYNLLLKPELFRSIYVVSDIWQTVGWGSIIYLAALTNIDIELYQAAMIDGAGRWKQLMHITLPGIAPTVIIMLILRMGRIMTVGFEKVILLYLPSTYETADVISTYVYRMGLQKFSYSYSTAIGLFNSVINCSFLIFANYAGKKVNNTYLW